MGTHNTCASVLDLVSFFSVILPSWACATETICRLLSSFLPPDLILHSPKQIAISKKSLLLKAFELVFVVLEMSSSNEIFRVF